jgi:flagellar basal body-associated protein FliL
MAANRTESAPTEEGAATAASNAAPSSGGAGSWLPLIVMMVLMPALAYAMTTFVIVPKLQKGLGGESSTGKASAAAGESSGKSEKKGPAEKKESVAMNKLLVNVSGTGGARYLLVSLSVVGSGLNFKEQMDSHDAQLRDMAQSTLRTKTIADLEKPTAQNMIRNELISGFNNILGDGSVEEIYFPEFAIQ